MTTLAQYSEMVDGKSCVVCDTPLRGDDIESYAHAGGWAVEGRLARQWLYVTCDYCDYQNSLSKLGVPR